MNRFVLIAFAAAFLVLATTAPTAEARPFRQFAAGQRSYQGTPIRQRPNRRGHIVGNTIRMFAR